MKFVPLALCLMLVSCTQGGDTPPPTTPKITAEDADAELRALLLSTEDVDAAYGDPGLFDSVPVDDASLYDNPDPRGACGAKIPQPDFQDAAIATFQPTSGPGMLVINAAWDLPPGQAASFAKKHAADIDPGCPPFRSQTPFHAKQRVQFLGEVKLPDIGDHSIGSSQRIEVKGQPPVYAGGVIVADDTRLVLTAILGESEPSERFIRELAEATGERLN